MKLAKSPPPGRAFESDRNLLCPARSSFPVLVRTGYTRSWHYPCLHYTRSFRVATHLNRPRIRSEHTAASASNRFLIQGRCHCSPLHLFLSLLFISSFPTSPGGQQRFNSIRSSISIFFPSLLREGLNSSMQLILGWRTTERGPILIPRSRNRLRR